MSRGVEARVESRMTEYPSRFLSAATIDVLRFIRAFTAEHGCPPTNRDIADGFGFKSTNSARQHIRMLVRARLLTKWPRIARGMVVTDLGYQELARRDAEARL